MKKIVFILSVLTLWASPLKAQYNFGDVQVSSMVELFNPDNKTLWGEKTEKVHHSNYSFIYNGSNIWSTHKFAVLMIYNKSGKKKRINLIANRSFEFKVLKDTLVSQLNRQFGSSEKVLVKHPFIISDNAQVEMIKWTIRENKQLYEIYFGRTPPTTSLIVYQSNSSLNN